MFSPPRLRLARQQRGLSRSQLHHELILLGVRRCRAMMDLWENGRSEPRATEVQALATVLQVPIAALYEPPGSEQ